MKDILKRQFSVIIIIVLIMIIFTYFFVFKPMKTELEHSLCQKFQEIAISRYDALENLETQAINGASSISSRSMIRKKIVEYLDGEIEFLELVQYTEDKYADGVEAIDNIIYAKRVIEQNTVTKHINSGKEIEYQLIKDIKIDKENDFKYYMVNDSIALHVKSYIFDDNKEIYDEIMYDVTEEIKELNRSNISVEIVLNEEILKILEETQRLEYEEELVLSKTSKKTPSKLRIGWRRIGYF